jgi:hypothetical protein
MSGTSFEVPTSVAKLGPSVVSDVEKLVKRAERREVREGVEATESALKIVPRPLRPVIRKVVGI